MQPKSLFLGTELKENYLVLINAQLVGNKVLVSTTLSKYESSELISVYLINNLLFSIDFRSFSLPPFANVNDVI